MALFVMADLHLPLGIDKPMDIFGNAWKNYVERIEENWQHVVCEEDIVVIPGDFSWATYLEESKKDFEFLNRLNGIKILIKGNHDSWWSTINKLNQFIVGNDFSDIHFMQNNTFLYKNIAICGSRGWLHPGWDSFSAKDRKIFDREVLRMELSLKEAQAHINRGDADKIYVFTHYPPTSVSGEENEMTSLFKSYGAEKVFYGHLHGVAHKNAVSGSYGGTQYSLISADYLQFMPKKIAD